jgi:hypothetical protein
MHQSNRFSVRAGHRCTRYTILTRVELKYVCQITISFATRSIIAMQFQQVLVAQVRAGQENV